MHRAHVIRRWTRRHARLLPRRVFVLLVTLTLLIPALAGGTPYVWCVGMHRAQMSCCCHGRHAVNAEHEHAASDVDAIAASCCVGQRLESVPTTHAAIETSVAVDAAPVMAFLTLDALHPIEAAPNRVVRHWYDGEARAGPEPPIYALDCAYLN